MTARFASLAPCCSRGALTALGFGFVFIASACDTGQIGGEIEHDDGGHTGESASDSIWCENVASEDVALDEMTEVGITPQELIDAIEGTHETSLSWVHEVWADNLTIVPEEGESTITIEVIPKPDSAQFTDRQERQPETDDEGGETDDIAQPEPDIEPDLGGDGDYEECPDRLSVDAEVIISTENGAINDTFEMTFWTTDGQTITGSIEIEPGSLEGSFDVETSGNAEAVQTALTLNFAYGNVSGDIEGILQEEFGEGDSAAVSASPTVYAKFPAGACDHGDVFDPGSPAVDAMEDVLSSHTEFSWDWMSGDSTTFSITPTLGDQFCLQEGDLVSQVTATVSTGDGQIDGEWSLEARGQFEDGELVSVTLTNRENELEPISVEDFADRTGIGGIETELSDLSFQFDATYEFAAEMPHYSGSFAVLGLTVPDCSRPDYEPPENNEPGGGQSSSGCEGIWASEEYAIASFREESSGDSGM